MEQKKIEGLLRVVRTYWMVHKVTISPFLSLGFHVCQTGLA